MKKIKGVIFTYMEVIKIFVFYLQIHSIILKLADSFYFDKKISHNCNLLAGHLYFILFQFKGHWFLGDGSLRGRSKHGFPQEVDDNRVTWATLPIDFGLLLVFLKLETKPQINTKFFLFQKSRGICLVCLLLVAVTCKGGCNLWEHFEV